MNEQQDAIRLQRLDRIPEARHIAGKSMEQGWENARLIVASVNHAEALAEALQAALTQLAMKGANRTESGLPDPTIKAGASALANWEGAKS